MSPSPRPSRAAWMAAAMTCTVLLQAPAALASTGATSAVGARQATSAGTTTATARTASAHEAAGVNAAARKAASVRAAAARRAVAVKKALALKAVAAARAAASRKAAEAAALRAAPRPTRPSPGRPSPAPTPAPAPVVVPAPTTAPAPVVVAPAPTTAPAPVVVPAPAPTTAPAPVVVPVPATSPSPSAPSSTTFLAPATSIFGSRSIWREDLRGAPVAADSAVKVADLARQVHDNWGGTAAFNNGGYSVGYVAATPSTPRTRVAFADCQGKGYVPDGLFNGQQAFVDVPIPADAVAAPGTDKNLTVYSASTDQLWEFWIAEKGPLGWSACWGGRIDGVSTSLGFFADGLGTTATGLSHAGGMVGIRELRAGAISHAMSLNVITAAAFWDYSWPAQRSDGYDPYGSNPIAEGTRFRLDPAVDVATLGLNPVATMIAKAAQTYGFIVNDKGGSVAVIAENGGPSVAGADPWGSVLAGMPNYKVLEGFPWNRLQALPKDYGRR
jgi:hypothetical protein